ncbi:hypothetical protein D3877_13010 [Azospirillum cavernae]|uniref:Tape measure protein N-terminal domain-containing protein n=1 Tax=Azospirillum cavernae TaxID=2320860 RepID=A0A418VVF6_9PROT|nr:hypothetical protein D3877_13010 [Azospirillum cavernae]
MDRLTAPITRMNAAMARLAAPARAVNMAMGNLANVSGVTALGARFQAVGGAIRSVSGHVGALTGKLAGLAGIGTIGLGAGAVAMGKSVVSVSAQFEKFETILTTIMGSNAKAKESMKWVADFAAKTPYELDGVMDSFVKLKSYGIDPTDGALQTLGDAAAAMGKPLNQAVEALADAVTGEMERMKEFGVKSKTEDDIVSMAFTDAKGRQRTFQAAKDDAKAMKAAVLAIFKAKGFDGAMDNLSKTWDGMASNMMDNIAGFWRSIGDAGSFDALKGKLAGLLAWIDKLKANGTLDAWAKRISDAFVTALTAIENKVMSVDWEAAWVRVSGAVADFVGWVQRAVTFVGGWENAAIGAAAVMNGALIAAALNLGLALGGVTMGLARVGMSMAALATGGVLSLASAFLRLNFAMTVTAARMALLLFAPLAAAVGNFVTALRAGYGVMAAFNLAMAASPIGLVIAAVAVLAAGAALLYQNWDGVSAWFAGLWAPVSAAFNDGFVQGVVALLSRFNPVSLVAQAVNDLIAYFTGIDLYALGAAWVRGFLDGFKDEWAVLTRWVSGAMAELTGWLPDWAKDKLGLSAPKGDLSASAASSTGGKTAPQAAPQAAPQPVGARPSGVTAVATAPAAIPSPANRLSDPTPSPAITAVASAPASIPSPASRVPVPKPSPTIAVVAAAPAAIPSPRPTPAAAAAIQAAASPGVAPPPSPGVKPSPPTQTQTPAPAKPPEPGLVKSASPTTTISAPVTVSITVNGVAELDLFKREAQAVVERALADWRSALQSDAAASLYDH